MNLPFLIVPWFSFTFDTMKKFLSLLGITVFLFNCSDGDLQIETIDFDSVTAQNCGTLTTSTRVFFKINDDEALILNLASGLIKNEASTETISSAIGASTLTYRIFSDAVSSGYFCDEIPPVEPVVTEEIEATGGNVLINTVAIDSVTFEHTIQLQDITLVNEQGERITDLTITDFGTVQTSSN